MAPKKRSRPSAASATSAGPTGSRRTSQRLSAGAAAKKSKYFEPDSDEGGDDHDEDDYDGNEDDDTDDTEGSVEDYSSDEDKRSRKKARPTPQKRAAAAKAAKEKVTKSKYEDKDDGYDNAPGSDEDESGKDDEDEEPRTRFIPKKQLRPEGNVKYADDRIHPNTMAFLRDLKANNKRSWLKENDGEFRRAQKDWATYVDSLTASVFTRADETIPEDLPASDLVFRIYRDVRFSKDQTPYKAHFSAAWSRTGRKGPYAGYYVHLEPGGKCFVGGGLWHPERDALQRLRLSIDQHPERWRSLLLRDEIVRVFYPGPAEAARKKEASKSRKQSSDTQLVLEAARKAFADMNKEDALKKCPKDFNPNHEEIELLKLKSFVLFKKVPDADMTAKNSHDKIFQIVSALAPFVTFLNSIVMPDPE